MKISREEATGAEVDAKSRELIQEFFQHYKEFTEANPGQEDKNEIFHGWAIQKIAGLQLVALELARKLNAITASRD
jgi:hypothetical protein